MDLFNLNDSSISSFSTIGSSSSVGNGITYATMAKAAKAQRRSACDDCRARKVQCSGDLAGCQRCRRAHIQCTYSAPKPPGRPRKIRKITEQRPGADRLPLQPSASTGMPNSPFFFPELFGAEFVNQGFEKYPFGAAQQGDGLGINGMSFGSSSPDIFGSGTPPLESNDYNFAFNSVPTALPPATPRSFSSSSGSSPSPLFPWSSSDDSNVVSTAPTCNALAAVPQPCSCLPAFFSAITTLRTPPSSESFSLPSTLTVIRTTLTTITTSMHCRYCHSSVQSTYVCMMMLGTLIPLLIIYIENALTSIATYNGSAVTLNLGGVEVELERGAWRNMASGAVRKEFETLLRFVDEIEGILQRRHCEGRGKNKEGLGIIARGGARGEVGEVVGRELANKNHETGEPPFCLGLLWMIRGMAQRVGTGSGVSCQ